MVFTTLVSWCFILVIANVYCLMHGLQWWLIAVNFDAYDLQIVVRQWSVMPRRQCSPPLPQTNWQVIGVTRSSRSWWAPNLLGRPQQMVNFPWTNPVVMEWDMEPSQVHCGGPWGVDDPPKRSVSCYVTGGRAEVSVTGRQWPHSCLQRWHSLSVSTSIKQLSIIAVVQQLPAIMGKC